MKGKIDMLDEIANILNDIREEKGEDGLKNITADMSLRHDLGFDSFDLALLTAKLEDEYDVDVFERGIIDKVSEILALVEK